MLRATWSQWLCARSSGRTVMAVASPKSSFLSDVVPGVFDRGGGTQKRALQDVRVHAPECALSRLLSRCPAREAILPCELVIGVVLLGQRQYVLPISMGWPNCSQDAVSQESMLVDPAASKSCADRILKDAEGGKSLVGQERCRLRTHNRVNLTRTASRQASHARQVARPR